MAKAQQREGKADATEAADRAEIVWEFTRALDAWVLNTKRLIAEGSALEKVAFDVSEPVPDRLICIRAAIRTWRELPAGQSEVRRLSILIAAGHVPDDMNVCVSAEYALEGLQGQQEDARLWIAEGEQLESELKKLPNPISHYGVFGPDLARRNSIRMTKIRDAEQLISPANLLAKLQNKPDVVTNVSRHYTEAMGEFTSEQLDVAEREIAKRRGLTLAQYHAALSRAPAERLQWPTEKWNASREHGSRKQGALFAFLRRVWKPFVNETGTVVTRTILAEIDPPAAAALKNALRAGPLPPDIGIVATRELKKNAARVPAVFRHSMR